MFYIDFSNFPIEVIKKIRDIPEMYSEPSQTLEKANLSLTYLFIFSLWLKQDIMRGDKNIPSLKINQATSRE